MCNNDTDVCSSMRPAVYNGQMACREVEAKGKLQTAFVP
jgi:hypothetical protein